MRQNHQKAAAEAKASADSIGPAYSQLLDRERVQDRRYRQLGRPRLLLQALEHGETVTVPWWRVKSQYRPPGSGRQVTVTRAM
jgi:hypothetical protein